MAQDFIEKIQNYFKDQPVVKAWLFGSYSRGEESSESDIDILVSFDENAHVGLFKYASMYTELSELLGRKVDLVQEEALKPYATASVEHDRILIYERAC